MTPVKLLLCVCTILLAVNNVLSGTIDRSKSSEKSYIDCLYDSIEELDACLQSVTSKPLDWTVLQNVAISAIETEAELKYKLASHCQKKSVTGFSKLRITGAKNSEYLDKRRVTVNITIPAISTTANCHLDLTIGGMSNGEDEIITTSHKNVRATVIVDLNRSKKNGDNHWRLESLMITPNDLFSYYMEKEKDTKLSSNEGINFSGLNPLADMMNSAMEPIFRNHFEKILRTAVRDKLVKIRRSK